MRNDQRQVVRSRTAAKTGLIGGAIAALLLSPTVFADSAKLKWDDNGQLHFYQLFNTVPLTWGQAQQECKKKGSHLATVTSAAEDDFIATRVIPEADGGQYYYLGATDGNTEGKFRWVTGEPFSYEEWDSGFPNQTGPSYLATYSGHVWVDIAGGIQHSYICEWSSNQYVGTAIVPDLNGNDSDEVATLFVNYVNNRHTVDLKDSETGTTLASLLFNKNAVPPQGLAVLRDLNNNGSAEIAVLFVSAGQPAVFIKDAKTKVDVGPPLLFLTRGYIPKAITVKPDASGNGVEEITVLGIAKQTGKAVAETRDAKTGSAVGKILKF